MDLRLGRLPHVDTPKAARLYRTRDLPVEPYDKPHRYWWQGGAWLNQGNEGTCVGHAFAHRRADATVPTAGITHEWARQLYLDASGDTTYQEGTYALLVCRELMSRNEISTYHWVTSSDELATTLLQRGPVCVGTNWYSDMYRPRSVWGNEYLSVSGTYEGGHEYVINGVDLEPDSGPAFYRMKNSWGTGWGKGGTARIARADLDDLLFAQGGDAVLIKEVRQ